MLNMEHVISMLCVVCYCRCDVYNDSICSVLTVFICLVFIAYVSGVYCMYLVHGQDLKLVLLTVYMISMLTHRLFSLK